MKDYGIVESTVFPMEMVVDEYSVWMNTDIIETPDGWKYHMMQYTKDEYIKLMDEQSQKAQADVEYIAMMMEVELE